MRTLSIFFAPALLLGGCGRELSPADVKAVGVGLDPEEIGPEAEYYGGVVEYDWVEFAGGQLPLALMGLVSYDAVGPVFSDFKAPYALVYGLGFVMDTDLPVPDALLGTFASPPGTVGTCQTVYEPFSFVNNLADVGNALRFESEDGTSRFEIERTPSVYPPDARDVFSYYFALETWRPEAQSTWEPGQDPSDPTTMTSEVFRPSNFPFGELMGFSFPGGAPPSSANVGSIPVPLASLGQDASIALPARPQGVLLSWSGPRYDEWGGLLSEEGEQSVCLQYQETTGSPESPADCPESEFPANTESTSGQMYTGPWETGSGLSFRWAPPEGAEESGETVSITVRFLGEVDRESSEFLTSEVKTDRELESAYVCLDDEDIDWTFNESYLMDEDTLLPSLQGDPASTLVEVTCTVSEALNEDGFAEFLLTEDALADAMAYARAHDSGGAVFYFTRSTSAAIPTPPVRDTYGKRRDTSPLLVVSRAVQLGRFWYGQ